MLDNFFAKLPTDLSAEVFEKLAGNDTVTIERIVSNGHIPKLPEYTSFRALRVLQFKAHQ